MTNEPWEHTGSAQAEAHQQRLDGKMALTAPEVKKLIRR